MVRAPERGEAGLETSLPRVLDIVGPDARARGAETELFKAALDLLRVIQAREATASDWICEVWLLKINREVSERGAEPTGATVGELRVL